MAFSTNGAEATGHPQRGKNKHQSKPHTLYKNELQMNHGLKCKAIKHLEKIGGNLWDLGLGEEFLD